jgi:hypothetical protein
MHIRTNVFMLTKFIIFSTIELGNFWEISFNVNLINFAKIWGNFANFRTPQK